MTKVYPNAVTVTGATTCHKIIPEKNDDPVTLTVWNKSLLFNCNGFTVYDCKGNLVFRVDNYMQGNKGKILLMDASGSPLLTIRRKRLSFGDNWLIYDGETSVKPIFLVKKHVNILNSKILAHVSQFGSSSASNNVLKYEIQGSYAQRSCAIYDVNQRSKVAEIKRKEAANGGVTFGMDVFRLIIQANEIQEELAMALVILLDQMFGGTSRFFSS
ncbi:hypothetical protein ACFE04_001105 [Oxalis oulophora]